MLEFIGAFLHKSKSRFWRWFGWGLFIVGIALLIFVAYTGR